MCKGYAGEKSCVFHIKGENKRKLTLINEIDNVEVCYFYCPIEYQLSFSGSLPKAVASFVTSALENLRLIMGNRLEIVSCKLTKGTYNASDRINDVYDYFQKNISPNFSLRSLGK